ncbi:MAG TPA: hypothetical protein VGM90_34450 [Kofleriaceae bacterium]|jgi:hypothetical protein
MTCWFIATLTFTLVGLEATAIAAPSAEELFEQGQASYDRHDYATAIAKWSKSYDLSKEPEVLFAVAQALRHDGRCPDALAEFRRFSALAPSSSQRPLADDLVRELTATCGATTAASGEQQPTDERSHDDEDHDQTRSSSTKKIVGLGVAGAGVASLAVGVYFGHRASSLGDEVTSACKGGCDWKVYGDKDAEGRSAETKQYVFLGLGGAAIIGGGVLYWWASREERSMPIAISSGHDGAVVTWSGSW